MRIVDFCFVFERGGGGTTLTGHEEQHWRSMRYNSGFILLQNSRPHPLWLEFFHDLHWPEIHRAVLDTNKNNDKKPVKLWWHHNFFRLQIYSAVQNTKLKLRPYENYLADFSTSESLTITFFWVKKGLIFRAFRSAKFAR